LNFLAHFQLAWPDDGLIAGALEGDYCKGPLRGELPAHIEQGVKLHRAIDAYTDSHPIIVSLRTQFPDHLRRYAGIIVDIAFDHYLTTYWAQFGSESLQDFNRSIYSSLDKQEALLSAGSRTMIKRLVDYDILNAYHRWDAVPATVSRVGERFKRGNPLQDTHAAIDPLRAQLEQAFLNFYPELQNFCLTRSSQCSEQYANK
jgi:acyl carrier protein phosphodiesterase